MVRRAVFQSREDRAFSEQIRGNQQARIAPPPSSAAPAPETGDPIGRLVIPRLHLRAIVREGADSGTLDVALGHVPGTALPGHTGNVAIAGHRDTLFRCLRNILKGDSIVLQTIHGSYTYHVERTEIVKPQDVAVLTSGSYSEITLITCYPFYYVGPAPDRFIVKARLNNPSPGQKLLSPRISAALSHSGMPYRMNR
jgi:LPXTG-site transpeptidase (sortase) family protein